MGGFMCLKKIRRKLKQWRHRDILKWREELNDFEKDMLIPEIMERLKTLKKYFQDIAIICEQERQSDVLIRVLHELTQKYIPPAMRQANPTGEIAVYAKQYVDNIKLRAHDDFVVSIDKLLSKYNNIDSLRELSRFLNDVNFECGTVVQLKEKLFLYNIQLSAVIEGPNGYFACEPKELNLLWAPFKVVCENIYSVAKATTESIQEWSKEQIKWKTNFLSVLSQRLQQRNQLLTIVMAISLSSLFLFLGKPYKEYSLERDNVKLKGALELCQNESNKLKNKMTDCTIIDKGSVSPAFKSLK